MSKFPERHSMLTQEEIDNPNSPIAIKEIESIISFPNRKLWVQMSLVLNSTTHIRKKLCLFSTFFFRK